MLLENRFGQGHRSLLLRLESRYGGRDAVGARVTVTTSRGAVTRESRGASSYLSQGDARLHFGLGRGTEVERVEIRWPEGDRETIDGRELRLEAPNTLRQKGSESTTP